MPPQLKVYYGPTGSRTEITNVVDCNVRIGRQAQLDAYNSNTASFTVRYPNGFASPNANYVPGTEIWIEVDYLSASRQIFRGRIADVRIVYGKPYASSTGPDDYLQIDCESYFAELGRAQGGGFAVTAAKLETQCNQVNAQFNTSIGVVSTFGGQDLFPATTLNGTLADWVNLCTLTMNGRMRDSGPFGVTMTNQYHKLTNFFGNFSDVPGSGLNTYEEITFDSLADNYYTQVTVDPESYAEQTVQTGSAPYRTYKVNTLNASTGQALDYANYLLATYKTPILAISSFRVFIDAQTNFNPSYGFTDLGTAIVVTFRGTTNNCILEGATYSATPAGGIHATFYVSGEDLNNYLLLDNAVYGKLDENKLGY